MNFIKYIILGIIQGLTEPIPVSSSGHIFLFKNLFNTTLFNSLNFEVVANFGSFLAILFIFRKDIIKLIVDFFSFIFKREQKYKQGFMYVIKMIISTIPVLITGLLFNKFFEDKFNNMLYLGIAFLITAILLFIVKNINGNKEDITIKDAIIIGLFQAIAIIPGISRSGSVLVACLLCKLSKEESLKYTFMLYFPVSAGSMILKVKDLLTIESSLILPYIVGFILATIVTYFSYVWLSNIVKKGNLWKFSIYCLLLSIFIFIYFR